jgi:hypothetical protein
MVDGVLKGVEGGTGGRGGGEEVRLRQGVRGGEGGVKRG